MPSRREMLQRSAGLAGLLAGLGLLPQAAQAAFNAAAFEAKTLAEVVKALGVSTPVESREVSLTGPEIAENGAVVPVTCACALPGVKRLLLLVEKNPSLLCAVFDVSDAVDASFSTRVKMGQSSKVLAVAVLGDGKVLQAQKEIKVTLGGCGGQCLSDLGRRSQKWTAAAKLQPTFPKSDRLKPQGGRVKPRRINTPRLLGVGGNPGGLG